MNSQLVRRVLLVAVIIAIAAAAIPGYHYYRYVEGHVDTDDAYVDGTVALVSSRVAGTVTNVYVEDNWTVKEGQLLLTLDQRDFDVRVQQAQAQLERARQSVDELYAGVQAARSGVSLVQSQLKQAKIDFDRAKSLKEQGVVSAEQYDQADTGLRIAMADESLAEHQLTQAQAALGTQTDDQSRYDRPVVMQAEAALQAAKLDLGYTSLTAPFAGVVTHKTAHAGNRVQAGEPLMAIVPLGKLYVTANFKETQLTDVRVGQKAEIVADIYPGYTYTGHVDSISMGTGAAFSLLPPENATGNWVKVVQRVPVKIVIEGPVPDDKPLRLGLSVEVAIDLGNGSGPLLSSIVQQHYQKNGQTLPNETLQMAPESPPPAQPAPDSDTQHSMQLPH
ncbi:MAG: HlyD family secretion protein [Candidatus Binatus sp.]|jgi:membrane fusion protein (multidrug efflux system)|uniref:HlyD family secretion protein n=1 Tax=Candidatus Binatus sp. TaxID=2811406 RepID=UPI003C72B05B